MWFQFAVPASGIGACRESSPSETTVTGADSRGGIACAVATKISPLERRPLSLQQRRLRDGRRAVLRANHAGIALGPLRPAVARSAERSTVGQFRVLYKCVCVCLSLSVSVSARVFYLGAPPLLRALLFLFLFLPPAHTSRYLTYVGMLVECKWVRRVVSQSEHLGLTSVPTAWQAAHANGAQGW